MDLPRSVWPTGVLGPSSSAPAATPPGVRQFGPFAGAPSPADALRRQCVALLLRTHAWLEHSVARHPEVNGLVPPVTRAVEFFRIGDYAQCLQQMNGMGQLIALTQAKVPGLPPW